MKHTRNLLAATLAAALALTTHAKDAETKAAKEGKDGKEAAAPAETHTIGQFKLGALITGPETTLEGAKGKAVVIEQWGIHCPPCLASLPDMEKLAKRHKEKLAVIGAHSQNATDEEVKAVVKKHKLSYAIVKGSSGPVSSNTIPHAYVFDAEGKMVWHGNPHDKEFERSVRKALPDAKK